MSGWKARRDGRRLIIVDPATPTPGLLPEVIRKLVDDVPGACWERDHAVFPGDCGPLLRKKLGVAVPDWPSAPPGIVDGMFEHQRRGVSFVRSRQRCLVALPPGTGKTRLAIIAAPTEAPTVVVTPAIARGVWIQQLRLWTRSDTKVLVLKDGNADAFLATKHRFNNKLIPGDEILAQADYVLLNYGIIKHWNQVLCERVRPRTLVCDEIHMIRNAQAQRTEALFGDVRTPNTKRLIHTVPCKIGLSGTPFNRPIELHSILHFLNPGWVGKRFHFGVQYCDGKHNGYGYNFNGSSNEEELRLRYAEIAFSAPKEELLRTLPTKIRQPIPVEIQHPERARMPLSAKDLGLRLSSRRGSRLESWTAALREAARQKVPATVEFIKTLVGPKTKVVVFTWLIDDAETIGKRLNKLFDRVYVVSGERFPNADDRVAAAKTFREFQGSAAFVATMGSVSASIDLSATDAIVFNGLHVSPDVMLQLEDRGHRIGLKHNLNVYYLIAEGTIDEVVVSYLISKLKTLDRVVGSGRDTRDMAVALERRSGNEDEALVALGRRFAKWTERQERTGKEDERLFNFATRDAWLEEFDADPDFE